MKVQVAFHVTRTELKMIKTTEKYKTVFLLVIFLILESYHVIAQDKMLAEGSVSFITGLNIYVRFSSTEGIENGDTLFIQNNNVMIPALIVVEHSSISCLCTGIGDILVKVFDNVFSKKRQIENPVTDESQPATVPEKDVYEQVLTAQENKSAINKQDLTGRLSISSYSNFSSSGEDSHRFRYTISSKATNISSSKISAETYISFTHKLNEWNLVQENLNNALKIYSLSLQYSFNEKTSLWAGRKINPRIANVGAIDGLQFEYGFKNMFAGVVAGSRPDYLDYGFNFNLFEYGGYFGHNQKVKNGWTQTSFAFFEQRNSDRTDRRFVYFQHTNSAIKNMNIFSSVELDLYRVENNLPKNVLSLTSLYLSVNYRVSRQLSVAGSYDNRKNVVYYETFRNFADEILQQASRQGFRFTVHYRPLNSLSLGANAGSRFRENDPRPSNTLNSFVTWSKVPGLNASLHLSANLMQTSYLDGQVYGAKLTKDIIPGKIYSMLNYRWVNFKYINSTTGLIQNIGEIDFSYQFNKKTVLSVNFEATFSGQEIYNRIYLSLSKRF